MGLLTPQMKAEIRSAGREVYPVLQWALPSGTIKLAKSPVNSVSEGLHKARVVRWGTLTYARSDYRNALQPVEGVITVSDTDRALAAAIRLNRKEQAQAAVATIKLLSPNVTDGSNAIFTGVIPSWRYNLQNMTYELRYRCADRPLLGRVPKLRITRADWPRAHDSVVGQPVPQGLYGFFKSDALGVGGALPTQYVDIAAFRYLVCHGYALGGDNGMATRVFVDDAEVTTGWSVERLTVNGRLYTVIKFTSDQGDAKVTLDGNGYSGSGVAGTGLVLERPVECIAHWILNFVWGDYQSGAWTLLDSGNPAGPAPIDHVTGGVADNLFTAWDVRVSKRIATDDKAENILNEWASSVQVYLYWTYTGRLGFIVEDPARESAIGEDPYPTDPWLRDDLHDLGDWRVNEEGRNDIDGLVLDYCYLPSQGRAMQSLRVENHLLDRDVRDTLSMPWSPAYLV